MINVLKELFAIQINIIHKLDEKTLNSILDEVIYKLTTSDLLEVGQYEYNICFTYFFFTYRIVLQGYSQSFSIDVQIGSLFQ